MAVPILENWSDIEGDIRSIEPDPELPSFRQVRLLVRAVTPVDDFANLLEGMEGQELTVLFPDEIVEEQEIEPGASIACRARRAGVDKIFVHRQHIAVEGEGGEGEVGGGSHGPDDAGGGAGQSRPD